MKFRRLISGISAFAVTASAFAGMAVTANAAAGDKTEVYSGTPDWSALTGSAATVTNHYGLDTSVSVDAAAHVQGGGSGDRRAYNYFTSVTPEGTDNVEVEFYLNIAGSNTNESHFYLMSSNYTANANPTSGYIVDIAYKSYLSAITVNGTAVTNISTNTAAAYQPTGESKYAATGLLKYDVVLNFNTKKAAVTIDGATTATYTVDFADSSATGFTGFYSVLGRALAGCAVYDVKVSTVEGEDVTYRNVTFNVAGNISSQAVVDGETVESVPETDNPGYIFKGWAKDEDTETLYSSEDVAAMAITADTVFTAQYDEDAEYVEAIASISITGADKMTFGPDPDTAESNPYSVVINGVDGTTITEDNISGNVTDFNVVWDIDGFKTENDTEGQYCDSYGEFSVNNEGKTDTTFELRNVPMNFIGMMSATITYNGETFVAEKAVAALGNTTVPTSRILPEGGYPSDFSAYSDSLIGYNAAVSGNNQSGSDVVTGNFFIAGSDTGRKAELMSEDEAKFFRVTKTTVSKSDMFAHSLNVTNSQAIYEQRVRFNSANSVITFTRGYPIWSSAASYSYVTGLTFTGTGLTLGDIALTKNDVAASFQTGVWYDIVISVDPSSGTAWAKAYNLGGELLGEASNVALTTASAPAYWAFGIANAATGTMDVAGLEAYYPTADLSTYTITASQDTLSIPNGDTADLSASLKTADGYDITGAAVWTVLEEDMAEGVIITPDAADSHKAKVTLSENAAAGEATVQVNIGGYTDVIVLNITSSAESVKFTQSSSSVSIPLNDTSTIATYYAIVVDGSGTDLERDVTFGIYDKTNTSEYTLPEGITFENGVLEVTKTAPAVTFTIRATGKNSDGADISKSIKVTVHGLAFDFGAGTDADLAEGYTAVTPDTSYTPSRGYGISSGTVTAGGTASTEDAAADYLEGVMTFKADVMKGKSYTVEIIYQGTLKTGYVNSDLAGYELGTQSSLAAATYTVPVPVDILDLAVSGDGAKIAAITITKNADKQPNAKPDIHHVGDSTAANNGSWAYHIDHNRSQFPTLDALATFYNNGAGGRNLSTYYTQGKLASVLSAIEPGDIMMFGNNGTNGMGSSFDDDVNFYLDAAEAMGAKIIINSYTPHGAVGGYASGYDQATNTFNTWRQDAYDVQLRAIAEERAESDPNYLGFVEIGKNADAAFNAYVADYAANGYASADAAAQAIIACFSDHNHYSAGSIARDLMLNGYGDVKGTVEQIVDILSSSTPEPVEKTIKVKSKSLTGKTLTAEIANDTDEAAIIVAMVAVYGENKKLVKVAMDQQEIASGGTASFIATNDGEGASVKAFIWNISDNYTPLTDTITE